MQAAVSVLKPCRLSTFTCCQESAPMRQEVDMHVASRAELLSKVKAERTARGEERLRTKAAVTIQRIFRCAMND